MNIKIFSQKHGILWKNLKCIEVMKCAIILPDFTEKPSVTAHLLAAILSIYLLMMKDILRGIYINT